MESRVWIAGELVTPDSLHRLAGRAMRYGDGVFVTLACEGGIPLDADAQLRRLAGACERVGLAVPKPVSSAPALADTLRSLGAPQDRDFVARVQVSSGPSARGYGRADPADSWEMVELSAPPEARRCRAAVAGPDDELPVPALPDVKSCSALAHVLAGREAKRLGVDELLRTWRGTLTEGVAANVFWVTGGALRTPSTSLPLYPGVTRGVVLETARDVGFGVEEGEFPARAVGDAEAVFLTNATRGIEPVAELDGRPLEWPDALERLAAAVRQKRGDGGMRL